MKVSTSVKIGAKHDTEFWIHRESTQFQGAYQKVIVLKKRGVRDFEDSSIEEAAKKLGIPKEKILEHMRHLRQENEKLFTNRRKYK